MLSPPVRDHEKLTNRMGSHFDDAKEKRNAPRRARKLENVIEAGVRPVEETLVPSSYRTGVAKAISGSMTT